MRSPSKTYNGIAVIARRVYPITGLVLLTALVFVLVAGCLLLNSSPVASFTFHLSQRDPPCVVTLDASASHDPDGIIVKYEWSFGDGASGVDRSASHVYTTSGTYTITLVVTDDHGKASSVSGTITVLPPYVPPPDVPPAPPDPSPPTPPAPSLVRFEGCDSPQSLLSLPDGAGSTFCMEYVGGYQDGVAVYRFSVVLLDALHQRVTQLADEYGDFKGCRYWIGSGGYQGPFFLDVVARGCWAITVFPSTEGGAPEPSVE